MDYITSAIARTTQHLNATHARIVYTLGLCLSRLFHVTLVDAAVRLALRAKPLLSLAKSDPTPCLIWTFKAFIKFAMRQRHLGLDVGLPPC
jgi:hypothetical protein